MLAHMKTQTINESTDEIRILVSKSLTPAVENAISSILKLIETRQESGEILLPAENLFPDAGPDMAMRGLRTKEGLTQKQLAEKLGITQVRISEYENKKRPIPKKLAHKIEETFGVTYKAFL